MINLKYSEDELNNSSYEKIQVNFSGIIARDILNMSKEAFVIGATSRGVFLKTDLNWVIFLTAEIFRNPLTINVSNEETFFDSLNKNKKVIICDGNIHIPSKKARLMVSESKVWNPRRNEGELLCIENRNLLIHDITRILYEEKHDFGLVNYLYKFFEENNHKSESKQFMFNQVNFFDLYQAYKEGCEKEFFNNIISLLGLGVGLTPSGDDFIIGFLLTCNSYPDLSLSKINLNKISENLRNGAYKKTNLLSANLIDCATQGLGDERLVTVLDGLVYGGLDPISSADLILQWGSSSGCDAFFGIATALLSLS